MMLTLIAIIMLLVSFSGYSSRIFTGPNSAHSAARFHTALSAFIALVLMLVLLEMGIAFIPALALSVLAAITLMERVPASSGDLLARFLHVLRGGTSHTHQEQKPPSAPVLQMSEEEARAILNVAKDASKKDIKAAYHSLIVKNHPDHGGSSYLAAKINQARDRLI